MSQPGKSPADAVHVSESSWTGNVVRDACSGGRRILLPSRALMISVSSSADPKPWHVGSGGSFCGVCLSFFLFPLDLDTCLNAAPVHTLREMLRAGRRGECCRCRASYILRPLSGECRSFHEQWEPPSGGCLVEYGHPGGVVLGARGLVRFHFHSCTAFDVRLESQVRLEAGLFSQCPRCSSTRASFTPIRWLPAAAGVSLFVKGACEMCLILLARQVHCTLAPLLLNSTTFDWLPSVEGCPLVSWCFSSPSDCVVL